jgi:2-polyprenyl-3-methyl-5-hydroxy-6-metoxy-1,4-benzoquinol methylase
MALDLQLDRPVSSGIAKYDVPACPACESALRRPRYTVVEHEYTTTTDDEFFLQECLDCGAWFLDPRPDVSALNIIYPPNYYAHVLEAKALEGSDMQAHSGFSKRIALALFRSRIRPIMKHLTVKSETTWLDVGCGAGWALETMHEAYGVSGAGLDMSPSAVEHCRQRGIDARVGRFEEYEARPGEVYDFVHSSHVIEHVESPLEYMRKSWELLKPGGLCVFITPNTATPEAKWFGRHWGGLHVPRHWTMLDPRSAKMLGERTGFEHVATNFSTNGTFWAWSFHSSLRGKIPDKWNDRLFPSDHRVVESSLWNLAHIGVFTVFDLMNVLFAKQSANMLCIFRKPSS